MRWINTISFQTRLVAGNLILLSVLLTGGSALGVRYLLESEQREMVSEAETLAHVFSASIKDAVISSDIATIRDFAESVVAQGNIKYVHVTDSSGRAFYKTGDGATATHTGSEYDTLRYDFSDGVFNFHSSIDVDGTQFGNIYFGVDAAQITAEVEHIRNYFVGFTLLLIAIIGGISSLFLRVQTRRLKRLRDAFHHLVEGKADLDAELSVDGEDEISQVARYFNKFVAKLRTMTKELLSVSNELARSSSKVQELAVRTSIAMETEVENIGKFTLDIGSMSDASQEVNQHILDTTRLADEVDVQSEKGRTVIQTALTSVDELVKASESERQIVEKLAADNSNIGHVLDMIQNVAEQTNLLALNAAIEAARAGDHGRGFAVVADEVRNLSKRTSDATIEIRELMQTIQSGSNDAVATMAQNADKAKQSLDRIERADKAFEAIARAINDVRGHGDTSARQAEEQYRLAASILDTAGEIDQRVRELASMASKNTQDSGDLSQFSTQLEQLAGSFVSSP